MKKAIYTFVLLLAPLTVFAQLKVNQYGRLQIAHAQNSNGDEPPVATVTIGDDPNYVWSDFGLYNMGILNCKMPANSQETIGLYSEVFTAANGGSLTQPVSTAICGLAYGSSTSNFGVVGGLNGNNGAGIYGTTSFGTASQIYGKYAGYFDGNTYVDGNLTASAIYNLSDIRLKKNVTLLSETASTEGNAIDHLQKLNVIEYNLLDPAKRNIRYSESDHFKDNEGWSESEIERRHIGLSAQELKEIYPNLVLEGQDGYLAVNYVELVPVLIRAIQELKQELDEVNFGSKAMTRSVSDKNTDFNTVPTRNILYQNTPNPFKEQTIIRFNLADDVQNAAICIFDMSGKTLRKLPISSGMESVSIGGYELGEGMFLYSLVVNGQEVDTKRMIISK
jgi:hypothetical protein